MGCVHMGTRGIIAATGAAQLFQIMRLADAGNLASLQQYPKTRPGSHATSLR